MPVDPLLVLGAAALEAVAGYPRWLHSRVPHPVVWIGELIAVLEKAWNRPAWPQGARRAFGVATLLILAGLPVGAGWLLTLAPKPLDSVLTVVVGSVGLAQRSLHDHVAAVARPLATGDIAGAREAVGWIVGRDIKALEASGVATAALESLAESFNDGVAAPMFWFLLAGLPGLFIYKAVNTADSMIGHREARYAAFGWAAARTDDLLNLVPARLAGSLVALAGGGGWRTMWRDARKHASPNAGWPEAAMAGVLGVTLGGPVTYDGVAANRAVLGEGPAPSAADLARGLVIYRRACAILWGLLIVGAVAWPR